MDTQNQTIYTLKVNVMYVFSYDSVKLWAISVERGRSVHINLPNSHCAKIKATTERNFKIFIAINERDKYLAQECAED